MRLKKSKVAIAALLAIGGLPAVLTLTAPLAASAAGGTRMISSGGTASMIASQPGSDAIQGPEIRAAKGAPEPIAAAAVPGPEVGGTDLAGLGSPSSTPALARSFNGLNHRQQRLANGGNQFSLEPPDQGLCAGNGFVFETVNDALRVFDTAGNPLTAVIAQNKFYDYKPAINRTTGIQGPFVTDPSCLYDSDTHRWFHVVLTLEVVPKTGHFTGVNHLDLAVSNSDDPTGTWTIYRLPVQDDGTAGTPDHGCSGANGVGHGPCIGDYPHIGADRNGFYITTNEYSFFGPEFKAAQVYAFDKRALAAGTPDVAVTQIDTTGMGPGGESGFTVWPAVGRGGGDDNRSGTEYFMSSDAASEVNATGSSSRIGVWALTNTRSLRTDTPDLTLRNRFLPVGTYTIPPKAPQKPGDHPLGECIADNSIKTPFGTGCWNYFLNGGPFNGDLAPIDTNDSRMQQVTYANGRLWSALDTGVTVGGENRAGVEWFIVKVGGDGPLSVKVSNSGYIAVEGSDVAYPAVGVTRSGKGVIAMTLMGPGYYPSAAYASIDKSGAGDIQIAAAGLGPQDGFTNYAAFVGDPPRERWGDYGAAVADGKNVWIASEYIGQTCSLAQYLTPPIGSCDGTRTSLANWGTRISQITP